MKNVLKKVSLGLLCAGLFAGCSEVFLAEEENSSLTTNESNSTTTKTYFQQCLKDKTITVGTLYKLNNNIWGASSSGAGTQCSWFDSGTGKWGVNASHTSGTKQDIKGYPSLVRGWIWYNSAGSIWTSPTDTSFPVALNQVSSFTSSWTVTVPSNGEKYNTSYDIWLDTKSNPNYKAQYEIMIWINHKGPAYNGNDFYPIGPKIASNVSVAGHVWNIYRGWNGTNNVFTFRRTSNTSSVNNLNILTLINYAKNQGFVQSNYYVLGIQAGFEIVAGGAFRTESYSSTLTKY
jgi:hypothetical protein